MKKYQVRCIELSTTTDMKEQLLDVKGRPDHFDVQNKGDVARIIFRGRSVRKDGSKNLEQVQTSRDCTGHVSEEK